VRRERDGDVKQERIVEEVVDLERNAVAPIALPAGAGERLPTRQCRSTCLKARQGARRPRTSRLRTPGGGLQVHAAAGLERTVGEGDPLGHCPRATETASKSFTLESGWGARAAQRRGGEQSARGPRPRRGGRSQAQARAGRGKLLITDTNKISTPSFVRERYTHLRANKAKHAGFQLTIIVFQHH